MLAALLALLLALPAAAVARPVVVELYSSQACSDCPPAEALLRRIKEEGKEVLPLDLHVTYFNGTGWTDPWSLETATARQRWYESLGVSPELYTPQAVVDGRWAFVGSDRSRMNAAIAEARREAALHSVPLGIAAGTDEVRVSVGAGTGTATLWLFGFDDSRTTHIGGGENSGATLTEVNVVRSVTPLGTWHGMAGRLSVTRPKGARMAVLLQQDDGVVLGATAD